MSIQVEVWGDYACFSRPEMKTERVSYDVMTPSAARGLLESIYWQPGMRYRIDRIYVLNPIRFAHCQRNEVKNTVRYRSVFEAARGASKDLGIYTQEDVQQRSTLLLCDVRYVIESHFDLTDKATPGDNPGKFQDILRRRLSRGQCYSQPYLGCREFAAQFREWPGGKIPALDLNQDLGYMLYDMDYGDPTDIQARFFHARLKNGVLDCRDRVISA